MERSGTHAPGALHATDLLDVLRSPGPFATVWATAPSPTSNDVSSAVNSATGSIRNEAFGEEVLAELERVLSESLTDGGVVVVADPNGIRLVERLPGAPRRSFAAVDALPSLSPVVEHRQAEIPFVVVMTDRQGADVFWSTSQDAGVENVATDPDAPISKLRHGGGWSHKRMQQRVENTWEQTAAEVADTVMAVAEQIAPRVVAVGGDVRMVQLLRQRLPERIARSVREIPGSRSEDGSEDHRDDAVRRWVRTAVAEDTVGLLQLFEQERGQRDRAADGPSETLTALREARVDVLLVNDSDDSTAGSTAGSGRRAWFTPEDPSLVADDPEVLRTLGVDQPVEARLVDVAIRAALATGAGVRVVPNAGPVHDGIGAVLRW